MTHNPLKPIRRAVKNSVSTLKQIASQDTEQNRPENVRTLKFESLEDRRVLSATGCDCDIEHAYVATDHQDATYGFQQDESIAYLKVSINGQIQELNADNSSLNLMAGDSLQVVEIGYASGATEGVFAAEGYINKLGSLSTASLIDYNDGRFTEGFELDGNDGAIEGFTDEWTVEAGWDRLTINLMHYTETSTEVEGRFFVKMQVDQPDLKLDTDFLDKIKEIEITAGDEVVIPARWLNGGDGLFHNYAEVDIYHDCDPEWIVWAGAIVGNAGDPVEGEFVNTRDSDPFSERWTPTEAGEYTLKYYIDPERLVSETNEDNNEYEIRLTVKAAPLEVAVDDQFEAGSNLDVMENDLPLHPEEVLYEENFEGELGWTTNPNGTDTATSGFWEAASPVGTAWNGVQLQLGAAEGDNALVTGGHDDGTVGLDDVDGGMTSAISEEICVPENGNAELSFSYTFAHLDNSSTDDFFRVSLVSDDTTEVLFELRGDSVDRAGEWTTFSRDLSAYAGKHVQLMVEAADNGDASLVEAGIDEVRVTALETSMTINEFSQGENGTVTLNEDGTFNYQANDGFVGEDSFTYSLTDGENISNVATVTVNVTEKTFDVASETSGDEDTAIGLPIETDYDAVLVEGVPADAFLNRGTEISTGVYEVNSADLEDLTITPAENSDTDFELRITPIENGTPLSNQAADILVSVQAVVDGGQVEFEDFGVLTGTEGNVPLTADFFDLDGSESHTITLSGLPDFIKLSPGVFDGQNWVLNSSNLDDLIISADFADDTSGWEKYRGRYVYKQFEIEYEIESFEANGLDSVITKSSFNFYAWQRK
jgi:VCBS repeat-containing protein